VTSLCLQAHISFKISRGTVTVPGLSSMQLTHLRLKGLTGLDAGGSAARAAAEQGCRRAGLPLSRAAAEQGCR
jgi:hypothetical protein